MLSIQERKAPKMSCKGAAGVIPYCQNKNIWWVSASFYILGVEMSQWCINYYRSREFDYHLCSKILIGNITRSMFWQMNAILVQYIIVYVCHIAFHFTLHLAFFLLNWTKHKFYHSTEFIKLIYVVHLIAPEHGFSKLHCCRSTSVPKIHCDHIVVLQCCLLFLTFVI